MKNSQNDRLLSWLRVEPINPLEAWIELGIYRLSARVNDLKSSGHNITKRMVEVQNRFGEPCRVAQYSLNVVRE